MDAAAYYLSRAGYYFSLLQPTKALPEVIIIFCINCRDNKPDTALDVCTELVFPVMVTLLLSSLLNLCSLVMKLGDETGRESKFRNIRSF